MYVSEASIEVRYYETDLMGIVHHSNYIRYFECARSKALKDLGLPIGKLEEEGIMMPVTHVECDYKFPAKMGDILRIVSTIKDYPKARIKIDSLIYNEENEMICSGSVTLGFINSHSRRPTRAPESVIRVFSPYFMQ